MTRPITRAGHIAYGRNRFCGADVFGQLADEVRTPGDLLVRAFGGRRLDDADREALRCVALAVTSPDARVWPLKLTRILASHGNVYAGYHGAQLANATEYIGPNAGISAGLAHAWIGERVGDAIDDASAVEAALLEYIAAFGTVGGFGVPFRNEDERKVELERMLEGHPITKRRAWRLGRAVEAAMRAKKNIPANVVSTIVAIATDFGIAPRRMGLFISVSMVHTFAAHALEACDEGAILRELPTESTDYRGRPPRRSPAAR